ncbi:unnamed protein product [marine sediment metagenome]|uniref:Uncharacterized protein n=1 Tax=marine sediment metagenome TaxID=412755 RepID=X1GR34_9ZZZZ
MNKKAEMGVGMIIMIAITAIVGAILLVGSAQNLHPFRNTVDVANDSVSSANTATAVNLQGQAASSMVVYNGTDDAIIPATNYTILNYQVVNGVLTATVNASAAPEYLPYAWNVSYTSEPDGYSTSAGARSMGQIILIFFGLGIAVVMLIPTTRNKIIMSFTGK